MALDSIILALPRAVIPPAWLPEKGLSVPEKKQWQAFLGQIHPHWAVRAVLERDRSFKQPIPYLLIANSNGELASYTRAGSEQRLHNLHSAGIGGHVERQDVCENGDLAATLEHALRRELSEEGVLQTKRAPIFHFLGVINEEESAVGQVHWGLIWLLRLAAGDSFQPKEELHCFRWRHPEQLRRLPCETWTSLALELFDRDFPWDGCFL